MKSFIYEAQSLEIAIKKAWESVGKPNVFFIKVVEKGNESIFWWKKKNFKIAFFYEIKSNVFEINGSFEKDFKKSDKKVPNEKNLQGQKLSIEKKVFTEIQNKNSENFQKKDFTINKNPSFENSFERGFEKKDYVQKDRNFENRSFDQRNKNLNTRNDKPFELKEDRKNEVFQKKNENYADRERESEKFGEPKKRLIWSDRQMKFLKSFAINFYSDFFEKKDKIDFSFDDENVCKINFGKGPFEDSMKNKDLSLSISTIFSEVLYSKFRDFDIRNCKIMVFFE